MNNSTDSALVQRADVKVNVIRVIYRYSSTFVLLLCVRVCMCVYVFRMYG